MLTASFTLVSALALGVGSQTFDPLEHLGGASPHFSGPNAFNISPEAPDGCEVDQVAFTARHGSRYPDPGAYNGWLTLYEKIQNQTFTTDATELAFLQDWEPVLSNPSAQLSQLSLGEFGPRVVDSARLFARGYLGPNATRDGTVIVLNNTDPRSIANSLAPSDLCANYNDSAGGSYATTWAGIYLPPIAERINSLLNGLEFEPSDVSGFPYLCGFETQITGRRSPWCDVFTEEEILDYEYAQDIRNFYGTGPGTELEKNLMLPFLTAVVERFIDGPDAVYGKNTNQTGPFRPGPLIATFTNDGQISQLAAATGVFDEQEDLPADRVLEDRTYRSTRISPMRGTIAFERLNCGQEGLHVRVKVNDAVYPVARCQGGPGRSCPLEEYRELVADKSEAFCGWQEECGNARNETLVPFGEERTTFLRETGLPFSYVVRP